jgi:hypothetical protein
MLLQLRPIAGIVCVAVAMPLLFAASLPALVRPFALTLFVLEVIIGTLLFWFLRTQTQASRTLNALCGLALGLVPYGFFLLTASSADHARPPVLMLLAGALSGTFGGLALSRLDPFERTARRTES